MKKDKFIGINLIVFLMVFLFPIFSFASIPEVPTSYYLDQLNMIDESTKRNITQTNRELEEKTGSQVLVATIRNNDSLAASDLGPKIFNNWNIGDQDKQNGALILITLDENTNKREIFVTTGYGIEGRLNDGKVGRIIDNFMIDELKAGNYSQGINDGFNSIVAEIADEYGVRLDGNYDYYLNTNSTSNVMSIGSLILLLIVFIIFSNILFRMNSYLVPNTRYYRTYPKHRRYYGSPYTKYNRGRYYDPFSNPTFRGGSSSFGGSSFGGSSSSGGFTGGGGKTGGGGAGRSF